MSLALNNWAQTGIVHCTILIILFVRWTKAHELMLKFPLSKSLLHDMVANSTAKLR